MMPSPPEEQCVASIGLCKEKVVVLLDGSLLLGVFKKRSMAIAWFKREVAENIYTDIDDSVLESPGMRCTIKEVEVQ